MGKFVSKENRHDGRGSFISTESVVISGAGCRDSHQIGIVIHCFDNSHQKDKKLCVLSGSTSRIQEVYAVIGSQRPVIMFSASVNSLKRFFVEETGKPVFFGNLFHNLHGKLVVINGNIRCVEDRGKLVLCRRYFVVFGFCRNAELPQLEVEIVHVGRDSWF